MRPRLWRLAPLLAIAPAWGFHDVRLDDDAGWTLQNGNGSVSVQVSSASSTHLALMEAGILSGDPYFRDNELLWSWVARDRWSYSTTFQSPAAALSDDQHAILRCQVDTVAVVVLNGKTLGNTTNMFVTYDFPVRGLLKGIGEENLLEVHIIPPLEHAASEAAAYPYPVPESVYPDWAEGDQPDLAGWGNGTFSHRNFVRKGGSDFGWDWGPAFVPSGIKGVWLVSLAVASLSDVTVRQRHNDSRSVTLEVEAYVSAVTDGTVTLRVQLEAPANSSQTVAGGALAAAVQEATTVVRVTPGQSRAVLQLEVSSPLLWWPAGVGGQPLYLLTVSSTAKGFVGNQTDESKLHKRIGLRKAELVREPIPGSGTSFYFKVNGVEVFAKGSNMIPPDVFSPRAAKEADWLLRSALESNQNMIRIWGGGWYQTDALYDLADELGIMIWQEAMFACGMYPAHEPFLKSVVSEITQQVMRLQHHASIVIWGGNNENEGAIQWYALSKKDSPRYVADYLRLYVDSVRVALRSVDPDVAFIDSSPTNGVISTEPYQKRWGDVQDVRWGDVHYYNYAADCEDFRTYPHAHFISEHGFQSFPSFLAYQPVLSQMDWSRNSPELVRRQRHPDGQQEMEGMLGRHFRLPPEHAADSRTQRDVFDSYLYLTQVQQSRCYETAIAQWRRLRSDPVAKTMGVLYWQLNDIWPGPSWSTLEHSGAWRLSLSAVQRSFAPLLPSLLVDGSLLRTFLTSDMTSIVKASLRVTLHRWDSNKPQEVANLLSCSLTVASGTAACPSVDLDAGLRAANMTRAEGYVVLRGTADITGVPESRSLAAQAFLAPPKDSHLRPAILRLGGEEKLGGRVARMTVSATAAAAYVTLESAAAVGRFVPNAFFMLPGEDVQVEFMARDEFDLQKWLAGVSVRSLRDTYSDAPHQYAFV